MRAATTVWFSPAAFRALRAYCVIARRRKSSRIPYRNINVEGTQRISKEVSVIPVRARAKWFELKKMEKADAFLILRRYAKTCSGVFIGFGSGGLRSRRRFEWLSAPRPPLLR